MSFNKVNNNGFKKKVSLWFKTSQQGQPYIRVCVTDSNGEETWVGLFENKKKKSEKSPDYSGVEFFREQDFINPKPQVANNTNNDPWKKAKQTDTTRSKFAVVKTEEQPPAVVEQPKTVAEAVVTSMLDDIPF